jgi:hypothetical protein
MMIKHDSKLTLKRYKSLHVKYFSQAVLNSISDKRQYMEEDIKNVYTHDDAILKVDRLLRHIYQDHVSNTVSHQSRVLHKLQLAAYVQISSGVEGLENPMS